MHDWSLLWTILRNFRAEAVNRERIGHTVTRSVAPVSAADAAAFGAVTGDPNPAYAEPGGPLPPMYIAKLVVPTLKRIWRIPDLRLNLLRTVHAEQTVRWYRPLYSESPLQLTMTVTDVRPTAAGELLEITGRCGADGQTAVEGVTGLLVRSRDRRPRSGRRSGPDAAGQERFRIGLSTWEGQQLAYARISTDRNFIHTSEPIARAAGLPRTVLHGACLLATVCTALTRARVGGDIERIERIACRFSRPVIPGSPLALVGYDDPDPGRVPFSVLDESGRPAIKNGLFCHR